MQAEYGYNMLLTLLWITTSLHCALSTSALLNPRAASDEERLLDLLFDGYNTVARPIINASHTVDVKMMFSLLQIQELNLKGQVLMTTGFLIINLKSQVLTSTGLLILNLKGQVLMTTGFLIINLKSQVLTSTGLLILEWRDERLQWDEAVIPLHDVVIEARLLWTPEFASINGAEDLYGDYGQFRTIIKSDGTVHWEPGGVFKTVCEIDITFYPFDEQHCKLVFGAWSYHTNKMNLSNLIDTVNMDSYEENGEWEIYRTEASRHEFFFEGTPHERFANIVFNLYLRRRYTFYIMNVILPSLMTSVLLLSIFFCTPAQKVQIGVVVLLSFHIFLLNVTGSIPKTSDNIPILGIYLTCTMAITTLSMVLTVLVLNMHHISDRPVPPWIRKLVLVFLARLLCMCHYEQYYVAYKEACLEASNRYRVMPNRNLGRAIGAQIGLLNGAVGKSKEQTKELLRGGGRASSRAAGDGECGGGGGGGGGRGVDSVRQYCSKFVLAEDGDSGAQRSLDKKKLEEEFAKDWRHVAEVMDRLFFWLFLSAILITTLILIHPLTKAYLVHLASGTLG